MVTAIQPTRQKVEPPSDAPGKMALDDFIVANGPEAFRQAVEAAFAGQSEVRSLEDYRAEIIRTRLASIGHFGLYLDTSATGSGKSYANQQAAVAAGTSLSVHPSHKTCEEVEKHSQAAGLLAIAYPQLSEKTCQNLPAAERALEAGLSPTDAICTAGCPFFDECDYHEIMREAEAAKHRIACHKRAELSLQSLAEGRALICIHEEATSLLTPSTEISKGLEFVETVALTAMRTEQQRIQPDPSNEYFYHKMEKTCQQLRSYLDSAEKTESIELPLPAASPAHLDRHLLRAMEDSGIFPPGDATRLVKAIVKGEVTELVVRVDQVFKQGGGKHIGRSILGVSQNKLPADSATCWICDATGDPAEIERAAGTPVINATPAGRLQQQHAIVQIPLDIKRSTARRRFIEILRAVLLSLPQYNRIGIICDCQHLPALDGTAKDGIVLDADLQARVAMSGYFRDGTSRGSNRWHDACDLLLIAGTPRVPPAAIKTRLIQQGKASAAARSEDWVSWGKDYWAGYTTEGRCQVIQSAGYRDHDWHAAYRSIVASELIQCIGRGRAILENGIPVVVLSTESLAIPLLDREITPMSDAERAILDIMVRIAQRKSSLQGQTDETADAQRKSSLNRYYLDLTSVSTEELAEASSTTPRNVRLILARLADRGLIAKVGERSGWRFSTTPPVELPKPAAGPGDGDPEQPITLTSEEPIT